MQKEESECRSGELNTEEASDFCPVGGTAL